MWLRSTPICTSAWATSGLTPVITTSAPRSSTAWAALTSPEATASSTRPTPVMSGIATFARIRPMALAVEEPVFVAVLAQLEDLGHLAEHPARVVWVDPLGPELWARDEVGRRMAEHLGD